MSFAGISFSFFLFLIWRFEEGCRRRGELSLVLLLFTFVLTSTNSYFCGFQKSLLALVVFCYL